jgi:hypothetical protein
LKLSLLTLNINDQKSYFNNNLENNDINKSFVIIDSSSLSNNAGYSDLKDQNRIFNKITILTENNELKYQIIYSDIV